MKPGRYRGGNIALPPQPPVWIPDNLRHGTSYVYRYYKCRCKRCQTWRRTYDRARDTSRERGERRPPVSGHSPWYVCVEEGRRYGWHDYLAGQCLRCDAIRRVEEEWERKWSDWKP